MDERTYRNDRNEPVTKSSTSVFSVRGVAGGLLLVVGVCVAIWVISQIGQLLWADVSPGLVIAITPDVDQKFTIGLPDGEITLSREIFTTIGYLLAVVLSALAVSLAAVLIKGGVALLQSGVNQAIHKKADRS